MCEICQYFLLKKCEKLFLNSCKLTVVLGTFLSPLYMGGLFNSYILDETIRYFRGVESIVSLLFYF